MLSRYGKSEVMLVAIEYGGQWQDNLGPRPGVDLIMVVQVVGEDPLVFARRFLGKLLGVIARGSEVISASMAVAPTFNVRHLEARCAIARTLLRVFRRGANRQLHLVEPSNASPACRAHLLAIAEGLLENAPTDCRISVGNAELRRALEIPDQPASTATRLNQQPLLPGRNPKYVTHN
jgi:hypothetical protein